MTHCADCLTPEAVHDEMWCEISRMAGRPIFTVKDLYPNEIENILRAWHSSTPITDEIVQNNWRGVDYGTFPDTRGQVVSDT